MVVGIYEFVTKKKMHADAKLTLSIRKHIKTLVFFYEKKKKRKEEDAS